MTIDLETIRQYTPLLFAAIVAMLAINNWGTLKPLFGKLFGAGKAAVGLVTAGDTDHREEAFAKWKDLRDLLKADKKAVEALDAILPAIGKLEVGQ